MLTLDELKKLCTDSNTLDYCLPVLDSPTFLTCPLNLEPDSPYSYVGGLCNHTHEIISSGILLCSLYKNYNGTPINTKEYIISAIWCNYGKLWEYICTDIGNQIWGRHVQNLKIETAYKSASEFESHASSLDTDDDISIANVVHNILSTLTQRPATPEAHLLLSNIKLAYSLHTYK